MAYGSKYQIKFLSRKNEAFTVDLALKDYTGAVTQLEGAADACLISYESGDDNIINPIRASVCTLYFFNTGTSPLSAFYSEDAEAWKITVLQDSSSKIIWQGFIVQDDCRELFQDPPHPVQIKATDNLALLKDIPFDKAWEAAGFTKLIEGGTRPITIDATQHIFTITEPLIVTSVDTSLMQLLLFRSIYYHISAASFDPATKLLTLSITDLLPAAGSFNEPYAIYSQAPVIAPLSLLKYVEVALLKTGIALPLEVYANIYENSEQDRTADPLAETFSQTHLYSRMFLNDTGEWLDCYSIIEKIFFALNSTLFQAGGKWVIIRWPELHRFTGNAIKGTAYSAVFDSPAAVTLAPNFLIQIGGANVLINADAERSILRPFKNVKFTFNYKQPKELIANINLQQLGVKIGESTVGSTTIKNFQIPYWFPVNVGTGSPDSFYIQVVYNNVPATSDTVETDRYLVIDGGNYGGPWLQSSSFPIDIGDRVNISFSFKTRNSNPGAATLTFVFQTDTGTQQYKINWENGTTTNGSWSTTGGAIFKWAASQNINEWTSFRVESLGVPVAGNFSIMLNQADNTFGGETYYKDFNIEYLGLVNNSLQVTGQYHNQEQNANAKNVLNEEIEIDDSPKMAFTGALFTSLQAADGSYLTLTKSWHRDSFTETRRLGYLTTLERQFIQAAPRTILEGTVNYSNILTSILNVIQVDSLPGLNLIFGITEFNLVNGFFTATLWEIYKNGDDFTPVYTFDYIKKIN